MARKRVKVINPELRDVLRNALQLGVLSIADACKAIRALYGFSQEDFANAVGLSVKVIKEIESGKANPRLSSLERLAAAADLQVVFAAPKGKVRLDALSHRNAEKQLSRQQDFERVAAGDKSSQELASVNSLQFGKIKYDLPELN